MLRYLPQRPMPTYSYVSGRYPHPLRDPDGHSYGEHACESLPLTEANWRQCQSYLWGVDLLNAGYYWEAHEAWEQAWIAVGRHGPVADFLKALIKLAAAGVKAREGRVTGVQRHANRSLELLSGDKLQVRNSYLGQSLRDLRGAAETIRAEAKTVTEQAFASDQTHELPVVLQLADG